MLFVNVFLRKNRGNKLMGQSKEVEQNWKG